MEKFIMADGTAIRIYDSVKGEPALVLLHGYLETIEVWDEFIPLLRGLRVVAPDLPGHGVSEIKGPAHTMEFLARTVHGAMQSMGIRRAYVAGHSMGGYVALEVLRLFPGAVEGIILLHSTPDPDSAEKKEQREREIALVEAGKKELLARTNPTAGFAPENRRRLAAWIEDLSEGVMLLEEEGITALLRGMEERPDQNDMLRASRVPQLFVFGRRDGHIPEERAAQIAAAHPQAQVAWLDESGHMGFIEQPEATADAVLSFINGNEAKKQG